MVVATATADGAPSARTVLLRAVDERGFAFYTNLESRKGREALANPRASCVFSWLPLQRQVVVTGSVERVSDAEADALLGLAPARLARQRRGEPAIAGRTVAGRCSSRHGRAWPSRVRTSRGRSTGAGCA